LVGIPPSGGEPPDVELTDSVSTSNATTISKAYEEILDISYFFALILTFTCYSFSTANTGDEVIFLHYFDFVSWYKKCK